MDSFNNGYNRFNTPVPPKELEEARTRPPKKSKEPSPPVLGEYGRLATRRDTLRNVAIAAVAMVLTGAYAGRKPGAPSKGTGSEAPSTETIPQAVPTQEAPVGKINTGYIELIGEVESPFEDENAREAARKYGISTESLVLGAPDLSDEYSAFRRSDVLPIGFPDVHKELPLFKTLHKEFPEISIAEMMVIANEESGGNAAAVSEAGAVGLFQLTEVHLAQIDERGGDRNDKEEQGRQAMKFFTEDCLPAARKYLGLAEDDQSAKTHLLAIGMYNAGPDGGAKEFEDQFYETQHYIRGASRQFQVLEVMAYLRDAGYPNRSIIEASRSPRVDQRGYALQYAKLELQEKGLPLDVNVALEYLKDDPLSDPETELEAILKENFEAYTDDVYSVPLTPDKRIQTALGATFVLGTDYENNRDPESYYTIP